MTDLVEVWLDADFLERTLVGTLTHDRGTLRFVYEPEWLIPSWAARAPDGWTLPSPTLGDLLVQQGTDTCDQKIKRYAYLEAPYEFSIQPAALP